MKAIIFILFTFQTSTIIAQESIRSQPDTLIIYQLPMFKHYFVGVCCSQLVKRNDVTIAKFSNRKKVQEAFAKFDNLSGLEIDTSFKKIDARLVILFKNKNEILKEVCATRTGMIQIDNKIYRMNKEIRDFFIANKMMINIRSNVR